MQQHIKLTNLKWCWYIQVAPFNILRLSIELRIFVRILTIRTGARLPLRNRFVLLSRKGVGIWRQVNTIPDFECVSLECEGGIEESVSFLV